jgi:hypothetical protein
MRTWIALAVLIGAVADAGAATYTARSVTRTLPPASDNTQQRAAAQSTPVQVSSQSSGAAVVDGVLASASADATARARAGGLHLDARASGATDISPDFSFTSFVGEARASASFLDDVFVSASSLPAGAVISGWAGFLVHGSLSGTVGPMGAGTPADASATVNASWNASLNVNAEQAFSGMRSCSATLAFPGLDCAGDSFGVVWVPVVLVNGQNNAVSFQGEVAVRVEGVRPGLAAFAHADLSHTIGWAGLRDLRSETGQAVSLTAISASTGLDYLEAHVTAVPEPATAWTLAAGAVLLGRLRARRRHAR